jgi:AcrR family transcriptional regulator
MGDALVELLLERPFDDITVQDVLDRAGVSRATFYTHYRDKNDLFLSDAEEFFERMATWLSRSGERSKRIAPVRELFAHVAEMRAFYHALVAAGRQHDVMELGAAHFARGIQQRMVGLGVPAKDPAERAARAHALAGALFSLLTWWLHHGCSPAPDVMDETFHRLVPTDTSASTR